jgi:hypothetical protein
MAGCLDIVSSDSSHRLFFLYATCNEDSQGKAFLSIRTRCIDL